MKTISRQSLVMTIIGFGLGLGSAATAGGGGWPEHQLLFADEVGDTDYFGWAVTTDGATALVGVMYDDEGSYGNAGSVCVFERSGGNWGQVDRLVASDYINSGFFGTAVAMSGDTAIFGARGVDVKKGAAYIFIHEPGGWVEQQKLTAFDGAAFDEFGLSVAIDGDTAVVGAYKNHHSLLTEPGAAYVFTRSGTVWSLEQKLVADVPASDDWFGYRVAIEGDTVVVSAIQHNATGAAYVFTRSGTIWSQDQKLTGSGGADDASFGATVDLAGDTLVVGSSGTDHSGLLNPGAAYVFIESGGVWSEQQRLIADDAAEGDVFGVAAIEGDTILVGAQRADPYGILDSGAAYVFARSGGTWTQQQKLIAFSPEEEARLGSSVTLTLDIALVGAPWTDAGAIAEAGAVGSYDYVGQIFTDGFESGDLSGW
jgi:hypothetical protein